MKNPNKKLCRNKVVIEISVSQLMALRVTTGRLTPMIKDIDFLIKAGVCLLQGKKLSGDDRDELNNILHEANFPSDLNELEKQLPLLQSLFTYDEND